MYSREGGCGAAQLVLSWRRIGTRASAARAAGTWLDRHWAIGVSHKVAQIHTVCIASHAWLRFCRELMLEYGVVKMIGNIVTQIIQGVWVDGRAAVLPLC